MPQNNNIQSGPNVIKPTYFEAKGRNAGKNLTTSTKTGDVTGELKTEQK